MGETQFYYPPEQVDAAPEDCMKAPEDCMNVMAPAKIKQHVAFDRQYHHQTHPIQINWAKLQLHAVHIFSGSKQAVI